MCLKYSFSPLLFNTIGCRVNKMAIEASVLLVTIFAFIFDFLKGK